MTRMSHLEDEGELANGAGIAATCGLKQQVDGCLPTLFTAGAERDHHRKRLTGAAVTLPRGRFKLICGRSQSFGSIGRAEIYQRKTVERAWMRSLSGEGEGI